MRTRRRINRQLTRIQSGPLRQALTKKLVKIEKYLKGSHRNQQEVKEQKAVNNIKKNSKYFFSYAKSLSKVKVLLTPQNNWYPMPGWWQIFCPTSTPLYLANRGMSKMTPRKCSGTHFPTTGTSVMSSSLRMNSSRLWKMCPPTQQLDRMDFLQCFSNNAVAP